MLAYSFDPVTGEYTGPTNAWESPLEPGVYSLPANSTLQEPPAAQEGKFRKWTGAEWELEDIPQPPPVPPATTEELASAARVERNGKLLACDWMMLPDVPISNEDRSAWATYRQALRDVPQHPSFPQTIEWPTEPEI